ncbi:hypothetical protein [Cytobacillus purgationiresistens]|uniref:YceG-like family protein n=1 Tax=Cytobacillus purgationiresistens TaxID=863449 RepID=A0ABU0AHB4_9BACI|nr:hypothetical protein [Cytobacillus purgationiresistens]MDQ0269450.1 hypothetical protein [Cytobacillus purgationiresistens]
MNKRNTRAFAAGVLISVLIIAIAYVQLDSKKTNIDLEAAAASIEKDGYIILTQEEYDQLSKPLETHKTEASDDSTTKEAKNEQEQKPAVYELTIEVGMTPQDIANQLHEADIVEDAHALETYIDEFGYSKKIQIGSFQLSADMTYKEIAELISR